MRQGSKLSKTRHETDASNGKKSGSTTKRGYYLGILHDGNVCFVEERKKSLLW